MNFVMCLAAISVICLLALHHLNVVALTCVLITMVDIDLIGSVYWWGLVRSQAIKKIYDRTFVSENDCL